MMPLPWYIFWIIFTFLAIFYSLFLHRKPLHGPACNGQYRLGGDLGPCNGQYGLGGDLQSDQPAAPAVFDHFDYNLLDESLVPAAWQPESSVPPMSLAPASWQPESAVPPMVDPGQTAIFHLAGGRTRRSGVEGTIREMTDVEIPVDEYKWRRNGKKTVKSSPIPRNYYRCAIEGCSAKKWVQRDKDDLRYVIITYKGTHNH